MGWVTPEAPTRTELAACVDCGLCLPHCPTFRLTGDETASPRGRLAAMRAVAAGIVAVDDTFEDMMGFCLQCRACESACPSLVPFGRAMEGARAELTAQRPRAGRRLRHRLVGFLVSKPAALRAATAIVALARFALPAIPRLRGPLRGLRPLPLSPATVRGGVHLAIGTEIGTVALLAGCVMDPLFGSVHEASVQLLRRAGYRVTVPPSQTCCGALSAHDGDARRARRLAARNLRAFAPFDLVVADAAGCSAHLKEYAHWAGDGGAVLSGRVRDIAEVIASAIAEGRLPVLPQRRVPVAMHDPCHLLHGQRVVDPPRVIVRAAGYLPVELENDLCCGAAGLYWLLRPDTADLLGVGKADQVRATGATLVASANPGCEMQLRSRLGDEHRIVHPVELYWAAMAESRGGENPG